MANLTITAASVGIASSSRVRAVLTGEAITHAQPVYQNAADSKYYKTDANASATAAAASAIAITAASGADQYIVIVEADDTLVNLGSTLVVGETYVVSRTAGAICPIGDLVSGDYPCILGVATTTTLLKLKIFASGVAKP